MKATRRIGVVYATFPAFSETFLIREFRALRQDSRLTVYPIALRQPTPDARSGSAEDVAGPTLYLRERPWVRRCGHHVAALCRNARGYWRALVTLCIAMPDLPLRRIARFVSYWFNGVALGHVAQSQMLDQLHGHFEAGGDLCLFAHLSTGIPFSITLHASDDIYYGAKPLLAAKLRYAAHIITDSRYNVPQLNLLSRYHYRDKIQCIYNGVPLASVPTRPLALEAFRPLRLLSVGSFVGVKGYPTALEALRNLRERGVACSYRIIGAGDREEDALIRRLIREYGLAECVALLGRLPVDDVIREMADCAVFLMNAEIADAGHRDGCPTVIAEAMLCGRVVVSTWLSDIPNVITDGETGYLVPEKSPQRLAAVLAAIVGNPEEAMQVASAAAIAAREQFDSRKRHAELVAALLAVTARPAGS